MMTYTLRMTTSSKRKAFKLDPEKIQKALEDTARTAKLINNVRTNKPVTKKATSSQINEDLVKVAREWSDFMEKLLS